MTFWRSVVGMGADHLEWAKHDPRHLVGIDLTPKAVELTEERLRLFGFRPKVRVADAEHLPFEDATFDIVYSRECCTTRPTPRVQFVKSDEFCVPAAARAS
jgi:ubiquinone/menaquinone biosynthesis C-methylase UbiE